MYEFVGRTEQEAIEQANRTLALDSSQFDVEILESEGGLFGQKKVRIRVYPQKEEDWSDEVNDLAAAQMKSSSDWQEVTEPKYWEIQIQNFIQELLNRMKLDGKVLLFYDASEHLLLDIRESSDPAQLIGKRGKHLEAFQVILNAYLGRLYDEQNDMPSGLRVYLDINSYRKYRMAKLVKLAREFASQVNSCQNSYLLEEMNSFERRIIHETLSDWPNISTVSEGNGMYKQVRIIYEENS